MSAAARANRSLRSREKCAVDAITRLEAPHEYVRRLVAVLFKPALFWRVMGKDSRDVIRHLEADGWRYIGATGSHHHYKHPIKSGKVTVPHPKRDLHPKTVRSIYRQAGLKEPR